MFESRSVRLPFRRLPFRHGREILGDHGIRIANGHGTAVFQPQRAVADGLDLRDRVRHEHDRDAAGAQLVDLPHAAVPKVSVSDGQGLVDQQDFGIDVDCHCKGQTHHHAARIGLDRLVDEAADFGELFDLRVSAVDLAFR